MTQPPDLSLLQPSLTEHDDAVGFDTPWDPQSTVMAAFFCGSIPGGYLIARNWAKLGRPEKFWPTMWAFLGLFVVTCGVAYFAAAWMEDSDRRAQRSVIRLVNGILNVGLALFFASRQKIRFRVFRTSDGEPESLWVAGLIAFAIGIGITIFGVTVFLVFFEAIFGMGVVAL